MRPARTGQRADRCEKARLRARQVGKEFQYTVVAWPMLEMAVTDEQLALQAFQHLQQPGAVGIASATKAAAAKHMNDMAHPGLVRQHPGRAQRRVLDEGVDQRHAEAAEHVGADLQLQEQYPARGGAALGEMHDLRIKRQIQARQLLNGCHLDAGSVVVVEPARIQEARRLPGEIVAVQEDVGRRGLRLQGRRSLTKPRMQVHQVAKILAHRRIPGYAGLVVEPVDPVAQGLPGCDR